MPELPFKNRAGLPQGTVVVTRPVLVAYDSAGLSLCITCPKIWFETTLASSNEIILCLQIQLISILAVKVKFDL